METLKKFFPLSFKRVDTAANLVVGILIYVVAAIVAGVVLGLAGLLGGWIPVVGAILGWALGVIGTVVEVYVVAGLVIQILVFTKVIKE